MSTTPDGFDTGMRVEEFDRPEGGRRPRSADMPLFDAYTFHDTHQHLFVVDKWVDADNHYQSPVHLPVSEDADTPVCEEFWTRVAGGWKTKDIAVYPDGHREVCKNCLAVLTMADDVGFDGTEHAADAAGCGCLEGGD